MPTFGTIRHLRSGSSTDCRTRTRSLGKILPGAVALVLWCAVPAGAQSARTIRELIAAGDAAWAAREHDAARAAYAEVVRRDSSYSRAVFRLGMLLAWKNSLDDALS